MDQNIKNKRALIVFPNEWISYSPTVLNLIECLKSEHVVDLIKVSNHMFYNPPNIEDTNISNIIINENFYNLLSALRIYGVYKFLALLAIAFKQLIFKRSKYDLVIGVDSVGFLATRLIYKNTVFVSLEIIDDIYLRLSKKIGIKQLVIQTKERKEFLMGETSNIKVSFIQNSPILGNKPVIDLEKRKKNIIYFGNVIASHGIESCIDAMSLLDKEYTLTIHGIIQPDYRKYLLNKYKHLFDQKIIIIETRYVEQSEVIDYLKDFYIGFCMYDFKLISDNDFNYISCPSGKLFYYYAAGVPVVGVDILGLNSIKEKNTGTAIQSSDITPQSISIAIINIQQYYEAYVDNCLRASELFDFKIAYNTFMAQSMKILET